MKIEIKNDLFNVVKRLQKIDPDYFVLFNTRTKKFELHNKSQGLGVKTYCLTFPFNVLDVRAVNYTHQTSVRNSVKLFSEIEKNNEKIENNNKNKILDESKYILNEIYSYANANSKDINEKKIFKTKWV